MSITGMTHPDTKKKVDVFALSIYGLVIFPKVLGHINDTVSGLFDQLDKRNYSLLRIRGYTKARQHFGGKMDGNSPESPRRRH
ncbi:hypothetical protein Goarm_019921 [Gossypium armourianum]|uniref:Uncharacterized protein n=1 Tax=Gossypium armourianum TaxID=34283 RepID=A0A7J9IMW2_9ROSI|nr:hypothetical protein [Gossypium armourianum]